MILKHFSGLFPDEVATEIRNAGSGYIIRSGDGIEYHEPRAMYSDGIIDNGKTHFTAYISGRLALYVPYGSVIEKLAMNDFEIILEAFIK